MLALALSGAAWAGEAAPAAADPELERRVMALAAELRCLVCQNQSLAESNAPLAADLKNQIREQMRRGASERQVKDYMVARYGEFILYRPPLRAATLLLWFGPLLLLAAGLIVLFRRLARRARETREAPLSDEERAQAAALLDGNPGAKRP